MEGSQKGIFYMQLNSLKTSNDPSILKGLFSVHDFEKSWNNQIITEEICIENMSTLINKPIVCKYISKEENNGIDGLTHHEQTTVISRDTGEQISYQDTIAIGTITNVYILEDVNNGNKKILFAEADLWLDKYYNICSLLDEWMTNGVHIPTSVEYLYCNYKVENKTQYVLSPIVYTALCILNAEQRGNLPKVNPAYDSSCLLSLNEKEKWEKAISQAIINQNSLIENVDINNSQKEVQPVTENLFYKSLCELSHGEIRTEIMTSLMKNMNAEEYQNVWISTWGVYDTYFIYENYENGKYVNYKVSYTKTDTEVIVDMSTKVQVERDTVWIEVGVMQTSVNELNTKIETLTTEINTANETITSLNTEKSEIETKFNTANETITALNSKVEELQPLVEQFNNEKIEKSVNDKKAYYSAKFKAVNAVEKFNSDEIQNLIKVSINETEEGKNATLSLNSMLVDLVEVKTEEKIDETHLIKELSSKNEKLIPTAIDFDSRYGN